MPTDKTLYSIETMPEAIPIFPLPGVLLLPGGLLPLHIFENRYINMIDDALKNERLIGMIQPMGNQSEMSVEDELYQIGCVGRITSFEETEDGRYYITLSGITRFVILTEKIVSGGYHVANVDWKPYRLDMETKSDGVDLDRNKLCSLLERYFDMNDLQCDWDTIDQVADDKLITCLSMVCPFSAQEKQALLEANSLRERIDMFLTMLEMAIEHGREFDPHNGMRH
jgi:Lon protease-like protein